MIDNLYHNIGLFITAQVVFHNCEDHFKLAIKYFCSYAIGLKESRDQNVSAETGEYPMIFPKYVMRKIFGSSYLGFPRPNR